MVPPTDYQKINPILQTNWLNNHALTIKINTSKYYFGEISSFLHVTFNNFVVKQRKKFR